MKQPQINNCKQNTLPIGDQILSGFIKIKALQNDFGVITVGNEDIAYFNHNNIYNYNIDDSIFFFAVDISNIVIEINGLVKQYPASTNKIAFNLHIPQKTLAIYGGPDKGTATDLPPMISNSSPQNFIYVLNDCGEVHLIEENINMSQTWQRCTMKLIGNQGDLNIYIYDGPAIGVWQP